MRKDREICKAASVGVGMIGNVRVYSQTIPPPSEDLEEGLKVLAPRIDSVRVISLDDYIKRR